MPRISFVDRKADQDVFDGDQPRNVRAYWIAELPARPKEFLVALRTADLEHLGVHRIEGAAPEGGLDHAAQPGGVEGHLLRPRIVAEGWKWEVDVLVPQAPQAPDVFRLATHPL